MTIHMNISTGKDKFEISLGVLMQSLLEGTDMKQVDILISKNQALQILYLKHIAKAS